MGEEKTVELVSLVEELPVFVDINLPIELKLRIIAAMKSYLMGVKNMDRVLARYKEIWSAQLEGFDETKQ